MSTDRCRHPRELVTTGHRLNPEVEQIVINLGSQGTSYRALYECVSA